MDTGLELGIYLADVIRDPVFKKAVEFLKDLVIAFLGFDLFLCSHEFLDEFLMGIFVFGGGRAEVLMHAGLFTAEVDLDVLFQEMDHPVGGFR